MEEEYKEQLNLVNAQEMAREHPNTFRVPSEEEVLDFIEAGDYVKLCVDEEKFWVKVTQVSVDNLKGTVDSQLINTPRDVGDEIEFHKDNIFEVRKTRN